MNPERLRQIEELYHQAAERSPDEREAFLAEACGNDSELLRDVWPLLAQDPSAGPMEQPVLQVAVNLLGHAPNTQWAPGTRVGPYQIVSRLAEGGMGDVYKARDTRLGREVAIKTAKEEFSGRFQREARAISALNHPRICTLHDIGPDYLVMELVEGETLASRLQDGRLPMEVVLRYGAEIADALAAAHSKGITHRDLKPANIMVTKGGIKLLDFGLAKFAKTGEAAISFVDSASASETIVGTPAYMAPEQLQGQACDARTDIFAFGLVLYEMAAGKRPFAGDTRATLSAAILQCDPPPLERASPQFAHLVKRCLAKDPENRWQSARDLSAELVWIAEAPEQVAAGLLTAKSRRLPYAFAAIAAVSAIALAAVHFRETPPEAQVVRASIFPPENVIFDLGSDATGPVAVSPDGRRLVFSAKSINGTSQLYVRAMDALTAQPLAGSDRAIHPFWSHDSRSIGFFADGKLKKIDASGGPAFTLSEAPLGRGGTWNRQGEIVFAPRTGPLHKIGGIASPVTTMEATPASVIHANPCFLPDGRHFLYSAVPAASNNVVIHIASLDSKEDKIVGTAGSNALYSQGYLLFLLVDTLMAQPFDSTRLAATADAIPLAEHVNSGAISVSGNGLLVYQASAANERLSWFERSGKLLATLGDPGLLGVLNFSPDRGALAISIREGATSNANIWIYDIARSLKTRFTLDPADVKAGIWSPDGTMIVFSSNRNGHADLYRKPSSRTGNEELLYADNLEKRPTSWSRDGKFLLYSAAGDLKTGQDLWVLPEPGGAPGLGNKPFPFQRTPFSEYHGEFSPDGRWISYQSDESEHFEIYAAPFRGPNATAGARRQISTAGGVLARWSRDGKEIFYVGSDRQLMAAEVDTRDDTLKVSRVRSLFGPLITGRGFLYGVSADGQRFLAVVTGEQKPNTPLTLVQNWTAGLKK